MEDQVATTTTIFFSFAVVIEIAKQLRVNSSSIYSNRSSECVTKQSNKKEEEEEQHTNNIETKLVVLS